MPILTLLYQGALIAIAIVVLYALMTGWGLPPVEWKDDDDEDE